MTQLTLDAQLASALKIDGLNAIERTDGSFVQTMRNVAIAISQQRGCVTSDDLRVHASQHDITPVHPNSWGAVMRGPKWKVVGRRKSAVPENHSREIKIFQYLA